MSNKIEIRLNEVKNAQQYSKYNIDEIGIGNEGCLHKLPSFDEISNIVKISKKRVKLILPFVPQRHLNMIKDLLLNITKENLEIILVINDIGILSYLQTVNIRKLTLITGRFFDWSYSMIPWSNKILRNETNDTQKYAMQTSMLDDKKLNLLKSMNVNGLELNATEQNIALIEEFKNKGFELYLHSDYNLLSTSRACAFKRMTGKNECFGECNELHEISISEKWVPSSSFDNKTNFVEDNEVKDLYPQLFMKNNMVFRKSSYGLSDLLKYDGVNIIVSECALTDTDCAEILMR